MRARGQRARSKCVVVPPYGRPLREACLVLGSRELDRCGAPLTAPRGQAPRLPGDRGRASFRELTSNRDVQKRSLGAALWPYRRPVARGARPVRFESSTVAERPSPPRGDKPRDYRVTGDAPHSESSRLTGTFKSEVLGPPYGPIGGQWRAEHARCVSRARPLRSAPHRPAGTSPATTQPRTGRGRPWAARGARRV